MAAALVGGFSSAQATPESQDAEAVGNALESFATRLASVSDGLGEYGDLAQNLPLTDLAPGDPGALDLSNLLSTYLTPANLGTFASMSDLATTIDGLDNDSGALKIQFGQDSTSPIAPAAAAVTATATTITIPIAARRAVSQRLGFQFGLAEMSGGSLAVDLKLDTTLTLTVDPSLITDADTAPATAVSLAPPTINLCADAVGSVGVFTARFGFTDLKVSTDDPSTGGTPETATLHACADVVFTDPDSTGGITGDEWASHALTELAAADIVDTPGTDLAATFYADASLVDGDAFADVEPADASIAFNDDNLANGFSTPSPSLGSLADWDNISAGDVANGLAQFVASLAGSQSAGDGPLPFLKKGLADTFEAVKPLTDYTSRLTSAEVGCGTEPGDLDSFPSGVTDNLTDGTLVYCRAKTQQNLDAGSVSWSVPATVNATASSGATSDATLGNANVTPPGPSPTADAVFEMTADGSFDVELTWDSDAGAGTTTLTAIPRPGTAQELFAKLAAAAGLDTSGGKLGYDSATKALTFRLQKANFDPAPVSMNASFGDLLRNKTNLTGLQDVLDGSGSTSFSADASGLDFDLTFGVLLFGSTSDITPLRGSATGGSGNTLTDTGANFTDGVNDPRLAQVVKNTTDGNECTIASVSTNTLTCASGGTWGSGDAYDVDGGLGDRFFVKVDGSQPEIAVDSLAVNGSVSLTGKVGFLEIEAGGDGAANSFEPGTAFAISKAASSEPVLRVDINTPETFTVDTNGASAGGESTLANTIGVTDLLFHLDDAHLDAVCNLKATAGLGIHASVDGTDLASGKVAVNWPAVFKAGSCEPDFAALDVAADTDFNTSLKDFDPFPSVSGTHTADGPPAPSSQGSTNLHDGTKDFEANALNGDNLLNLTLRNKTTGASCTIVTVDPNELECTLSGGTRSSDTANANKWKFGDEYEVEGNALAFLGLILDHLTELVDQIDQIDPGLTEKEIPLVGISTKDLVAKIQSVKQTIDELRGSPLAEIDCSQNPDGTNSPGFDLQAVPDNTIVWCRAISTVEPDAVTWTAKETVGATSALTVTPGAFLPGGGAGNILETVGPDANGTDQDDRVQIGITDNDPGDPLTTIEEWQVKVEFTDAAGNHTAEFPSSTPPTSLQDLEKLIGEKLGVDNVLKLDLLDLPKEGAGAKTSGTATAGSTPTNVLEDSAVDFPSLAEANRPDVGNLLINKTDNKHCTITLVSDHTLTCAPGAVMAWDASDAYEVVGDGTKDLIVRLGVGFCSGGGLCEANDRTVDPIAAPLNVSDNFGDIVAVDTAGEIALQYDASAQLDIGIPIKLDLTPDVVVLDTTGAEVEAKLDANDVGLSASIGPVSVKLGSTITDTDPVTAGDQPGVGIGKVGAKLSVGETTDDSIADNNTFSFGDYFSGSNLDVNFAGQTQECDAPAGAPVEATGHACALINVEALGVNFADPIKIECNIGGSPICNATLPPALEALIAGKPLDWSLLLQALPQILANLEKSLDGAAQDIHIPLIGDTLDAGANVVGTFNDSVVTPLAALAAQLTAAGNQDGDSDVDAYDLAKLTRQFVLDEIGPAGVGLLRNTNGIPADPNAAGDIDDIVITPLCGSPAVVCANGDGVTGPNLIKDFRVTFKIGQAIDGDVPFDIGLRGVPVRLTGGVHGAGSWSLLVDFGLSAEDGGYIVANGKPQLLGKTEKRPFDVDTDSDSTNDAYSVVKYLQDDDTNLTDAADIGMWLQNTTTNEGCRVTKVEIHTLWCDDFGTSPDVEGVDWHGADQYELRARHAPDTPGAGGAPELSLSASVTMGNLPGDAGFTCTDDRHDYTSGGGDPAYLSGFSDTRCLAGELAFLAVTIRDTASGDDCDPATPAPPGGDNSLATGEDPTALCLNASLDFQKSGKERVSLSDLISGDFDLGSSIAGDANIDVRFRTGLNVGQSAGFPSVLGKFHLYWGFSATPTDGIDFASLDVGFDGINLDAGQFISQFLTPILKQVKNVTGPLMPVVETLQGEVPIISDLSKLVGDGPVTVLDVLEEVSGNDLSLLRSILQFVRFVNTLPSDGNLLISLGGANGGSFDVSSARAGGPQPLPEDAAAAGDVTPGGDTQSSLIDDFAGGGSGYAAIDDAPDECASGRGSTFGVCGLTFPFLGDAGQIFGVLMGKDATLARYDAGTFGAGAGFGFCFPPILIGPVPVQICIGGSFRVEGRFAMGYDTSGLRKVLDGGSGVHLLDGIFLDDYDVNGAEVPEITFTGTVYAEGAISVYIFKVGIRGEVIFTTNLDLHEDNPQDGKLRIEEIISRLNNPLCLFDVNGKIEAALSAFVEIDLFITSVEFSIEIVRITLLEFNLDVCEPEPPVLARVETVGDLEKLILHMGLAEKSKRNIQEDAIDEKFTVRQMESYTTGPNSGKTRFSVTAFGIQQDYFLTTSKVGTADAVLIANADTGDDIVSLLPGGKAGTSSTPGTQNPPVAFSLRADISAGDGNDEITTGDGSDEIDGDPGNDRLLANGGNDMIRGGTGDDKIDAGAGDDSNVHGNGDRDVINGGKGGDKLFGDSGDDTISAGPDSPAATSVDELEGGAGNDTVTADGGNDKLWGDENLAFDCLNDGSDAGANAGSDNNHDVLIGADGNDQMHGGSEGDQLDGGNGDDTICGGGGPDEIVAGANKDTVKGGGGDDDIVGGTDNSPAADGGDLLNGDAGRDYILGDEGTLTRNGSAVTVALAGSFAGNDTINGGSGDDFMWGQGGTDAMNGDANDDEMRGGLAVDTMHGNSGDDEMYGEDANDVMFGDAQNDLMRGGTGADTMEGNADSDEMYGDSEIDVIRGGAADDLIRGGGGGDLIEGNGNGTSALPLDDPASPLSPVNADLHLVPSGTNGWAPAGGGDGDVIYGDADQDDIVGGSQGTPAEADSGDTILGNAAQDVILGDDGDISRPGGNDADGTTTRAVSLRNPGTDGGGDYIQGNDENDDIYAGGAGDLVHGDAGDDYVEGNGGADGDPTGDRLPVSSIGLYGDIGQDDLIGGTSQADGGIADGADDIWGGQGADVATGDNADVTRAAGSDCPAEPNGSAGYDCNTFKAADAADVVIRRIQIWDVATTAVAAPAGTSAGDTIGGQDGHDRLYGQGGDDYVEGGGNDDLVFGNNGADVINGNDGQDDLVGGTGRTDSATPASATDGRLDGADVIQGQADFDAIAGDNARVVRQTQDADANDNTGLWKANTFNGAVDRLIALMDVGIVGTPADASTSGNDQLLGGAADDVVYGQGGNDGISGGDDQDLLEGNANGSGNAPDPAATYGAAWPTVAGDVIHGDAGADDVSGGTGRIYRMVGGVETQDVVAGVDGRLDGGDTIFGDAGGDAIAGDNTVIERALTGAGAWILDDLHSPDALAVVRRVMRQRDVATTANLAPLANGTSGADTIYGNDGPDVAYGQAGEDVIQGNAGDDHLEGSANDDTITGNEGRDDVVGGTGRTFSNDESTAAAGRIDNPTGDDAANDSLSGGDGAGGVAANDDDVILGDNGTVDRVRGTLGTTGAELNRLPFNGAWGEASWDEPNVLRVIRLLDVATTADTAPESNATNGDDTIAGEANEDVVFGGGGTDAISGDDADLDAADPGDTAGDDYLEGNGGTDTILGNLGQDDITGGGSASHVGPNGLLDANRDGTLDPTRSGETLRDGNDLLTGDSGVGAVGQGDVIAGDNARIQRLLSASGDWRLDSQRGTTLRDVTLFDLDFVGVGEPGDSSPGESGVDTISGNGGEDILLGQANGAVADAYGTESGVAGLADCQNATGGPGSGTLSGVEEVPNGDDDNDDLPDLNDPQCRSTAPGDTVLGEGGNDYIEGNQGSDNTFGGEGEDDVVGGSSSNSGRLNVILPPADRSAGFAPGVILDANRPFNLLDGHDFVQGNAEDDVVIGDNAFVDRYVGAAGVWLTLAGPGTAGLPATPRRNEEPARGPWTATNLVRRDVTTRTIKESAGAFGNDLVQGGGGKDDVYGLLGNDWLEGNEDEDAIVGDMGKIVNNQLGGPTPDTIADPPLSRFITPDQPFLGSTINYEGILKREVELYAFDESQASTVGIGHDVALGGDANDAIHTGPGEDLANGNAGDDRIWLGDNFTAMTALKGKAQPRLAHDRVDAGWGGTGHDHLWGGYGADYLDVRPRSTTTTAGLTPTSDPETWFQVAGKEPSHNGVSYNQENFEGFDYVYGGWDQDAMQANEGANGPIPGDRLLDWAGVYNAYYVCPPTYGDWVSTRAVSPGMVDFLQSMSQGFGARDTATRGTSGFRETAIVFPNEHGQNANPIHPDTPAHFTCGPGVTIP